MTRTAKHTPGPSNEDIMTFFDLSDDDWDDLTGRMQDQLRDAYISHTDPVRAAAPAMYEALQALLALIGDEDLPDNGELSGASICDFARSALAQAEGRQG